MVAVSVSLLLLLIIAFSAWTVADSYRTTLRLAERQFASYAYALREHAERVFSEAEGAIQDTIDGINHEGGVTALSHARLSEIARQNAHELPQIASIVVIDPSGKMLATSLPSPSKPVDVSDRDYYAYHKESPAGGLFISRPFKSRISGKWRFTLSRSLLDNRGSFNGIVAVAFDIEYFQRFYRNLKVGNKGRIALVSSRSPVLVMEPFSEKTMTLDYRNSVLFREKLPKSPVGTFHIEKGVVLDTPARIISYNTLNDYPVIALVSMDKGEVLDTWKTGAARHTGTTLILCVIIVLLARLHLRHLNSLEEANVRLLTQQEEIRLGEEQRRRVESQLRQSQKMESIGFLAGGIAHDFNNLLTPIIGYAELLKKACRCGEESDARINGILDSARRSKILTQQLLGFARKQLMEMKVLDINRVIETFNSILRRMIRGTIEVRISLAGTPIPVRADRSQIEQVILNLAVNAQDAIAGHGAITITTDMLELGRDDERLPPELQPGRYASIIVADTGCGMDESVSSQIFEPFFTTKQEGHGTGLGLAMVYGIIMQHEGAIRLKSTPGEGSKFEILLPAVDELPCETDAEIATVAQPGGQQGTVLVVEDNEMVRDMVIHLLAVAGYRVISSDGPLDALSLITEKRIKFDLLLSDVIMPGMNGPELYEQVRDDNPDMKVLFISGYTNDPTFSSIPRSASVDFLSKPFSVDELIGKVREVLAGPSDGGEHPLPGEER